MFSKSPPVASSKWTIIFSTRQMNYTFDGVVTCIWYLVLWKMSVNDAILVLLCFWKVLSECVGWSCSVTTSIDNFVFLNVFWWQYLCFCCLFWVVGKSKTAIGVGFPNSHNHASAKFPVGSLPRRCPACSNTGYERQLLENNLGFVIHYENLTVWNCRKLNIILVFLPKSHFLKSMGRLCLNQLRYYCSFISLPLWRKKLHYCCSFLKCFQLLKTFA